MCWNGLEERGVFWLAGLAAGGRAAGWRAGLLAVLGPFVVVALAGGPVALAPVGVWVCLRSWGGQREDRKKARPSESAGGGTSEGRKGKHQAVSPKQVFGGRAQPLGWPRTSHTHPSPERADKICRVQTSRTACRKDKSRKGGGLQGNEAS